MTDLSENQFEIRSYRMDELEEKFEKINRRCDKLSMPHVTFEVIAQRSALNKETKTRMVFNTIELRGTAPVINGFKFVARIEHTKAGVIIARTPGCETIELPASVRNETNICEHCNTARNRLETFVVVSEETGKPTIVGRNCLRDFIGSASIATAIALYTILGKLVIELDNYDDDPNSAGNIGGGGRIGRGEYDRNHFLALTLRAIQINGWVSKKAAYECEGKVATAAEAGWAYFPLTRPSKADREAWANAQPTEKNFADVAAVRAWVDSLEGASEYEANLKVGCTLNYVSERNTGLVASAPAMYLRSIEKAAERAHEATLPTSEHFGTVGARYLRTLTTMSHRSIEGDYGVTTLYMLVDNNGNRFKWFSSSRDDIDDGETLVATFGIKSHDEWKGALSTGIARLTTNGKPAKWINTDTGEIFKTRKAMNEAAA